MLPRETSVPSNAQVRWARVDGLYSNAQLAAAVITRALVNGGGVSFSAVDVAAGRADAAVTPEWSGDAESVVGDAAWRDVALVQAVSPSSAMTPSRT
jgi:hypothetical protein